MEGDLWYPGPPREWHRDRDVKPTFISQQSHRRASCRGKAGAKALWCGGHRVRPRGAALTGAGVGKWPRGLGAAGFSDLACRKPSLSRLLSSLLPDGVRPEEPAARMLVG